jgi:hypothetical protein
MAELKQNPTPEEMEEAAGEGWYPAHGGKVWSRYESGRVDILDLRLFEALAATPPTPQGEESK